MSTARNVRGRMINGRTVASAGRPGFQEDGGRQREMCRTFSPLLIVLVPKGIQLWQQLKLPRMCKKPEHSTTDETSGGGKYPRYAAGHARLRMKLDGVIMRAGRALMTPNDIYGVTDMCAAPTCEPRKHMKNNAVSDTRRAGRGWCSE